MCTYSAGCLVISPSSGHGGAAANNIPYSIALLDAQGSTVSAVPAQEQPPQIGRLVADNREQFRVRTWVKGRPSGFSHRAFNLIYRSQYCFTLLMLTGKFI